MSMERMPKVETGESAESLGAVQWGPDEIDQFPGSKIFTFLDRGEYKMYAVRRNAEGVLEGNSFTTTEQSGEHRRHSSSLPRSEKTDIRIEATQQMHEPELSALEKVLEAKGIKI